MMWFVNFVSLLLVGSAIGTTYNFDLVSQLLDRSLKYLEKNNYDYRVGPNCSYPLALGAGEIFVATHTIPKIPKDRLRVVDAFNKRIMRFVKKTLQDYPDSEQVQVIFRPEVYPYTGDYSFIPGKISKPLPLKKSLYQIYKRSIPTGSSKKCISNLLKDNEISSKPRKCIQTCDKQMFDSNMMTGVPPDERINYLTSVIMFNCTNQNPTEILMKANKICNYIIRDVDTMQLHRDTPIFDDLRYFYLNKVLSCATFGFPEFFRYDYIDPIVSGIKTDGSVGSYRNNREDRNVLTAQTVGVMAALLRMMMQEEYQ